MGCAQPISHYLSDGDSSTSRPSLSSLLPARGTRGAGFGPYPGVAVEPAAESFAGEAVGESIRREIRRERGADARAVGECAARMVPLRGRGTARAARRQLDAASDDRAAGLGPRPRFRRQGHGGGGGRPTRVRIAHRDRRSRLARDRLDGRRCAPDVAVQHLRRPRPPHAPARDRDHRLVARDGGRCARAVVRRAPRQPAPARRRAGRGRPGRDVAHRGLLPSRRARTRPRRHSRGRTRRRRDRLPAPRQHRRDRVLARVVRGARRARRGARVRRLAAAARARARRTGPGPRRCLAQDAIGARTKPRGGPARRTREGGTRRARRARSPARAARRPDALAVAPRDRARPFGSDLPRAGDRVRARLLLLHGRAHVRDRVHARALRARRLRRDRHHRGHRPRRDHRRARRRTPRRSTHPTPPSHGSHRRGRCRVPDCGGRVRSRPPRNVAARRRAVPRARRRRHRRCESAGRRGAARRDASGALGPRGRRAHDGATRLRGDRAPLFAYVAILFGGPAHARFRGPRDVVGLDRALLVMLATLVVAGLVLLFHARRTYARDVATAIASRQPSR